jgi:probable lipoprotein NlpC
MKNNRLKKSSWGITVGLFFLLLSGGLLLTGCSATRSLDSSGDVYTVLHDHIPSSAKKYMGFPYKFGGDPDKIYGADCSHLVTAVTKRSLKQSNYKLALPAMNTKLILQRSVEISKSSVGIGDIVFFNKAKGGREFHAGVVTKVRGENIFFVHASSQKGVIETSTKSNPWTYYWQKRFHSYRRWTSDLFITKG